MVNPSSPASVHVNPGPAGAKDRLRIQVTLHSAVFIHVPLRDCGNERGPVSNAVSSCLYTSMDISPLGLYIGRYQNKRHKESEYCTYTCEMDINIKKIIMLMLLKAF